MCWVTDVTELLAIDGQVGRPTNGPDRVKRMTYRYTYLKRR